MALQVVRDAKVIEQEWSRWLDLKEDPSPFCQPQVLAGLNHLFGWENVLLQVNNELSAWCSLRKRGPLADLVVPPLTQFTPILARPELKNGDVEEIVSTLMLPHAELPYSRFFSLPPSFGSAFPGHPDRRVQQVTKKTFHVACAPLEEALSSWSSSHRRTFRHENERFQFHVDEGNPIEIAQLTDAAYRRGGSRLAVEPKRLHPFVQQLTDDGLVRTVHVTDTSGDLKAGIILLVNKEKAWYWVAGSHRGPAMTVLLAHTLAFLHEQGIKTLDMVGANTPAIAEFKRRFGGIGVDYLHVSRRSLVVELAEKAGSRLRSKGGKGS